MKKRILAVAMSLALSCSTVASTGCISAFAAQDEKTAVTVHFSNDNAWDTVNVYSWTGSENQYGVWPGTPVNEDSLNSGWYTVEVSDEYMIFNGSGQTESITNPGKEAWVYADATVVTDAPEGWVEGSQASTGEAAKPDSVYYIVGEKGLTGYNWGDEFEQGNYGILLEDSGLGESLLGISLTDAVVKNIAKGDYEFKVVQDPKNFGWSYGFSDNGNNFKLSAAEDNSVVEFGFADYSTMSKFFEELDTILEKNYEEYADLFKQYGLDELFDEEDTDSEEEINLDDIDFDEEDYDFDYDEDDEDEAIVEFYEYLASLDEMGKSYEYEDDNYYLSAVVYTAEEYAQIEKYEEILARADYDDLSEEEIMALLGFVSTYANNVSYLGTEQEVDEPETVKATQTAETADQGDASPKTADTSLIYVAIPVSVVALAAVIVLAAGRNKKRA